MFEDDRDDKIYNLVITNGIDKNNEYGQFTEKLFSKVDFLWKESISGSYELAGEGFYKKVDRIILLAGLYNDNKELFGHLLNAAEKYEIPIVLVRSMGIEEVPEVLEEKAATIVGWNATCIIDAIKDAPETMLKKISGNNVIYIITLEIPFSFSTLIRLSAAFSS